MPSTIELEILNVNEDTGEPSAISFHPSSISSEALRIILCNQMSEAVVWPFEVHYYRQEEFPNAGVYRTIDAIEFIRIRKRSSKAKEKFIDNKISILKDLHTSQIIFAEPLIPREHGR